MAKLEITPEQERLARFAKAMGHPTRIAILIFLAQRNECFFGDIHEVLPIAKATVSQHLSELKEAGLIQGTIEPPKVKYCINPENWELAKRLFSQMLDGCCPSKKKAAASKRCFLPPIVRNSAKYVQCINGSLLCQTFNRHPGMAENGGYADGEQLGH